MKELFIIRHAKSSWKDGSVKDFDRPLNDRGKDDAPKMGERMKKRELKPDLIVSSPANRAITTAKIIAGQIDYPEDNIKEDLSIYGASVDRMIDLINNINDEVSRLYLFGHNPTFTDLSEQLSSEHIGNLPTCGIVGLKFEIESWQFVSKGLAELSIFDYPKKVW